MSAPSDSGSTNPAFDSSDHHPRHQRPFDYEHLSREAPPVYTDYLAPYYVAQRKEQQWKGQMNDHYERKKQSDNLHIVLSKSDEKIKERDHFKNNRFKPALQDRSVFQLKHSIRRGKKGRKKRKFDDLDDYVAYAMDRLEKAAKFGEIGVIVDDEHGLLTPDLTTEPVWSLFSVFFFFCFSYGTNHFT